MCTVRPLVCIVVAVTGALSACAAISGLDSYSAAPGSNAREAGDPSQMADGAEGGTEDSAGPSDGGSGNEGSAADDATCPDGVCTGGPDAGAEAQPESGPDAHCSPVALPP